MTDLFVERFFQKKYLTLYLLMIGSTISTAKVFINYRKNKNLNFHSLTEKSSDSE